VRLLEGEILDETHEPADPVWRPASARELAALFLIPPPPLVIP
jgi:hypothetical protein